MRKQNLYANSNPRVACRHPSEETHEPPPITSPTTITPTRSNVSEFSPDPAYAGQSGHFAVSASGKELCKVQILKKMLDIHRISAKPRPFRPNHDNLDH